MDSESGNSSAQIDCKEMKREDLLEFSTVFASEFNNSGMHDRVLVFQIMKEQRNCSVSNTSSSDKNISVNHPSQAGNLTTNNDLMSERYSRRKRAREDDFNLFDMGKLGDKDEEKEEEKMEEEEEKVEEEVKVEGGEKEDEKKVEEKEKEEEMEKQGRLEEEGREVNGKQEVDAVLEEDDEVAFNEHKIFVHSSWLAVQSPYFKALFYSGMKESHSKKVVMKIMECELQAHLTLVEAMYRLDVLNDKDDRLVLEVLILANKYDVKLVFKKCKYVLMSTSLTLEKCEHILEAVKDLPDCADILGVIEKFLVSEFTPLDKTWTMDKFTELSEASLKLLFSSNDLAVQSENTIFVALMHWIDTNYATARILLTKPSLLSLVRFELLTVDFLYDVVRHHALAKKMPGFTELLQKSLGYHGFSRARQEQLEDKPVKRPSSENQDPSFSWVIDKSVRKRLTDSPHIVYSSLFWFQGYEMKLALIYKTDSKAYNFYLRVLNMKKDSYLDISCTAKSKLFNHSINLTVLTSMYNKGSSSWGNTVREGNISLLEVPEATSHTINVQVKFN